MFSVKESLLGALMSLTLFPPNKQQSCPKQGRRLGCQLRGIAKNQWKPTASPRHSTLASFRHFYCDFLRGREGERARESRAGVDRNDFHSTFSTSSASSCDFFPLIKSVLITHFNLAAGWGLKSFGNRWNPLKVFTFFS